MAATEDMAPSRPTARKANGTAHRAPRRAKADDIEAQIGRLQDDIRAISRSLTNMGEDRIDSVKSAARLQANDLLHRGQEAVTGVQDEFGHMEKQIKDTIREKPLTAVAGAIALGFLFAVITR